MSARTKMAILSFAMIINFNLLVEDIQAQWSKSYGNQFSGSAYSIRTILDGGYVIAGLYNFSIIILLSNGLVDWQKLYTIDDFDTAWSIRQTQDGGYIVAGTSSRYDNDIVWILKLKSDGSRIGKIPTTRAPKTGLTKSRKR